MELPDPETVRVSAAACLRERGEDDEAELLGRSKLELSPSSQRYINTTVLGLQFTLRCAARDLNLLETREFGVPLPSPMHTRIKDAISAVLPGEFSVHHLAARSALVNSKANERTELERLVEAQKGLMIAVATGGPRIEQKNAEYSERRLTLAQALQRSGHRDPNPFSDLWQWYGRWSSGDLPSYQSRRDFVASIYQPLLESLAGLVARRPSEPESEPTGWTKVDRTVQKIVQLAGSSHEEEDFQTVGLLSRECLISLAEAVYDPARHAKADSVAPSRSDAARMLEGYFGAEYEGSSHEVLRAHAKASLKLAVELQHKRTATYRDAALCAEATRTVVNIIAIMSGRR
jgi:hypothetical protein